MTTVLPSHIYEINNVKNIYNIIADEFNKTRGYYWKPITEFIKSIKKKSTIYDIGCGNGRNMTYEDYKFIGVDNCEKFVEICKNKDMNAICCNMTNITLESNSADAILCIATFHHLENNANRVKALQEMKRLLKPNGTILLTVWSFTQPKKTRITFDNYGDNIVYWKNIHPRYYYIFRKDEIETLFTDVGLFIVKYQYDCGNEVYTLKA